MTGHNQPSSLQAPALNNSRSITPKPSVIPHTIFDRRQKTLIVAIVSIAASFSGFASNIYFPALPTIANDLNISIELVNLSVTCYLIFQGLAPSLWGPVSDVKGRRLAYCCTFVVFFGACIGLANTTNYATLIVLRCLQSAGSASTIAIGAGVIGDITTREDRGGYMGIFQGGLLVPVAVGPVIGGALSESLGWRSIFWFLAIFSGVFLLLLAVFLPETLRSVVGDGRGRISGFWAVYPLSLYQRMTSVEYEAEHVPAREMKRKSIDMLGPLRILISRSATPIIVFLAVHYMVWQMSITAMSTLFASRYRLKETEIGLTFIANGAGSMFGTLITGKLLNVEYHRVKSKFEEQRAANDDVKSGHVNPKLEETSPQDFPLESARLRLIPILSLLQTTSILLFGWTIQFSSRVPIAVPIISSFITGWTAISTQSAIITYLVDVFPDRSAAASASVNLARCLLAAGGSSVVMPLNSAIGVGWTFSICALLQLAAGVAFVVQWQFAARWRKDKAGEKREDSLP